MSTQINDLEAMQGATERTVTVDVIERTVAKQENGDSTEVSVHRKVFVRPMPMRRWVMAMSHATAVIQNLPSAGLNFDNPMQMSILIMHVIGKIPVEIFSLLELATDQPADFYDRIDLDDGVKIVQAVIQVNKDFFVQKVLPLLSEVAPALKEKVESTFGQKQ